MNSRIKTARGLRTCLAWVFVIAIPGSAWCATGAAAMPEHARASRFGGGWECVRGFREHEHECVHIVVPPNGYLNSFGSDWQCNRGYSKHEQECVQIKLPENAYIDDSESGSGWSESPRRMAASHC